MFGGSLMSSVVKSSRSWSNWSFPQAAVSLACVGLAESPTAKLRQILNVLRDCSTSRSRSRSSFSRRSLKPPITGKHTVSRQTAHIPASAFTTTLSLVRPYAYRPEGTDACERARPIKDGVGRREQAGEDGKTAQSTTHDLRNDDDS